jgi:hypothetical protein
MQDTVHKICETFDIFYPSTCNLVFPLLFITNTEIHYMFWPDKPFFGVLLWFHTLELKSNPAEVALTLKDLQCDTKIRYLIMASWAETCRVLKYLQ